VSAGTPRPPETTSPAYARGVDLARQVRVSTIDDLAAIVAAGDTSREAEANLRLWMLDRLRVADATDEPVVSPQASPPVERGTVAAQIRSAEAAQSAPERLGGGRAGVGDPPNVLGPPDGSAEEADR
jgi:hypothetical protein